MVSPIPSSISTKRKEWEYEKKRVPHQKEVTFKKEQEKVKKSDLVILN